jgi:ATP-dependent RNA helicase DDX27
MAPIIEDDFILTISDDGEVLSDSDEEIVASQPEPLKKRKREEAETPTTKNKKAKKGQGTGANATTVVEEVVEEQDITWADQGEDDGALASDFEFQVGESTGVIQDFDGWDASTRKSGVQKSGDKKGVDIDEIIARRKAAKSNGTNGKHDAVEEDESGDKFEGFDDEDDELLAEDAFGMGGEDEDEDEDEDDEQSENSSQADEDSAAESDDESVAAPVTHPDDLASASEAEDEYEDPAEVERRVAFFAPEEKVDSTQQSTSKTTGSFQTMGLSRPILKGLAAVGFSEPTPIQAKTIPVALLGKDVVGGAVTGSGKTAAFIIPILERLLYRPKKVPTTRVAILMPTRELAVQCFNVSQKLASFTDVTFAQIVGGFSLREQENVLRTRPDVIIATPGRFIDHMRNSPSFAVDTLEILVLDEADRMLEDGFADELNEILTTIPKSRQTMLFSATMTSTVDKLIRVGLNRPVRLMVDAKKQTVAGLIQEFVRLRPGREDKRLACLLYLCENVYTEQTIIFFRQKKEAHRVRIVFALCGLKAAELHGSMSQEQVWLLRLAH